MSHAINAIVGSKRSMPFLFQVKTDNAGTSASNQFKLPLEASGTYDFTVDWGDTTDDVITVWNQAETTHTYASAGTYTISITGRCVGWTFNNGGDRLKFLEVFGWGGLRLGNSGGYFYGCENLVLDAVTDVLNLVGVTTFQNAFRNCDSIVSINKIQLWNTGSVSVWTSAFRDMLVYNDPNFQYLDMSGATTLESLLRFSKVFNYPIPLNWPLCTNLNQFLNEAEAFNQSLSGATTQNVTFMISALNKAFAFNQDISGWDVGNLEDATSFMEGKTTANYSYLDNLYAGWAAQTLQPNVTAGFGTIQYTSAAVADRAILTGSPNNWVLTDGGVI